MGKRRLLAVGIPFVMVTAFAMMPAQAGTAAGVGVIADAGYPGACGLCLGQ